ncbi:SDR family oxidoreductase [Cryobacterium sp. TMS1-13-1]|uniref:SDR family oxidoreductase n=1 Tax=Cryobacterium sp. TMS1-13-1 TaxID=1259220 RepID=UPI00106D0337|nr:SDR family oxidoreductase [Cryobacterium sp. TMS1-13-1]TFD19205.1 SDR family oxidoreductase [Cryobacterium sp. TMS1-13-1]
MKIAIAGATGAIGTHVLSTARSAGHETIALSRAAGIDLTSPRGLADRLVGVETVIDLTSTRSLSARVSVAFFATVTENLLAAEHEAGVRHHVALSIIGASTANSGYYAGKAAQERKVKNSDVPWSLLRTTQFHEFAEQTVSRGSMFGLQLVPAMRSQPIAAREVAVEVLRIATGEPLGLAPDLAGPREEDLPDMVTRYLNVLGQKRPVLRVNLPGAMGRAMRHGGLLPASGTRLGKQTFQQWLDTIASVRTNP